MYSVVEVAAEAVLEAEAAMYLVVVEVAVEAVVEVGVVVEVEVVVVVVVVEVEVGAEVVVVVAVEVIVPVAVQSQRIPNQLLLLERKQGQVELRVQHHQQVVLLQTKDPVSLVLNLAVEPST
jgi:hypothetical protein